jgi:hypothetical protein
MNLNRLDQTENILRKLQRNGLPPSDFPIATDFALELMAYFKERIILR